MLSRRNFIKGVGIAAATPILAQQSLQGAELLSIANTSSHKILTCNIRVDLPEDQEKGLGWKDRKKICIDVIKSYKPDIICLQEVLRNQNEDMGKAFPDFQVFGFEGPEMDAFSDGYHGIAKNPILFSKKRYELLSAGEYWLSQTPLIAGSLSWNSARARHANWVRLRDKQSNKDFRLINLHLDHKSQPAREQQIAMVLAEAKQYKADYPQLLTGDFNSHTQNAVYNKIKAENWIDTYTQVHGTEDPGHTIHEFQGENYNKKDIQKKIDFIFLKGQIRTVSSKIIKDNFNGKYPSDHYFVSSEISFS